MLFLKRSIVKFPKMFYCINSIFTSYRLLT